MKGKDSMDLDLLPGLSSEEFAALKADIKANGVLHAVFVDEDGNILDGRHRLKIDPNAPRKVVKGLSPAEKEAFVFRCNFSRRNLSRSQRDEITSGRMKETARKLRAEDAKKWTQAKIGKALGVAQNTVSNWFDATIIGADNGCQRPDAREKLTAEGKAKAVAEAAAGRTHQKIADDLKVSRQAISKALAAEAARQRNEEIKARETKESSELYDVIVIDPPWPIKKIERDCRPNQVKELDYPTMELEEIAAMKLPAAEDCHLWVWTTHRFLPDTLGIVAGWGFAYVCAFTWHKNGGFQPVGLPQYNCEFALYCRRGSPKFTSTKDFKVCFGGERGKHSEKPEEFYEMVRRTTDGRRRDMFNRRKIEGFDGWGNESDA